MERLWSKVDVRGPGECWPWIGRSRAKDGRGVMWVGGRTEPAPRVAWRVTFGPPSGSVLHTCDNPPCCNPAHLYEGDQLLNTQDAVMRGRTNLGRRGSRGETNPQALLTDAQAAEVRRRYAAGGVTQKQLAAAFGVHQTTISLIVRRRSYR